MDLKDLPFLNDPIPEIEQVPPEVERASGGNLTELMLLAAKTGTVDLALQYARAVNYAQKRGTPEDLEILSAWGREYYDLIGRSS